MESRKCGSVQGLRVSRNGLRDVGLEFGRGERQVAARSWKDVAETFVIRKEEDLILDDRAADVGRPLVGDCMGTSLALEGIEPAIRVQHRSVVVVVGCAVKGVGTGLGGVVDHRARCAAVFRVVSVLNHRRFGQFSLTQRQVGAAGVVQIEEGILIIEPIQYEEIRDTRQTVGAEVAVSATSIHDDAGQREGHGRDITTGGWELLELLLIESRCQGNVLRVHQGKIGRIDVNHGRVTCRGDLDVAGNRGSDDDRHFESIRLQTGGNRRYLIRTGFQRSCRVTSLGVRDQRLLGAGSDVQNHYLGSGNRCAGGVCHRAADGTGHRRLSAGLGSKPGRYKSGRGKNAERQGCLLQTGAHLDFPA